MYIIYSLYFGFIFNFLFIFFINAYNSLKTLAASISNILLFVIFKL
jgi:hypothetical protein